MEKTKVLIIGAGAAGLCAAKHVSSCSKFICRIFEQTDEVGGTWVYTDDVFKDKYGSPIHSSMYQELKTNLPKEVMQFLDFPFSPSEKSYLHHSEVLQYLRDYAEHNHLLNYLELHKKVEIVQPMFGLEKLTWKAKIKDLNKGTIEEDVFDAVMVCNGHYSVPNVPDIPGIQEFKGSVIHSHVFRVSDPYKGKNVVIWGASASGRDISIEISSVAKSVTICHRHPETAKHNFPENVKQAANIISASEDGFTLEDGTECKADAFIYCTGYHYDFPFLSKECAIEVKDNRVTPLYKHLINIEYPSMCLLGLPFQVLPFVLFDFQVQYFLKTLDGTVKLPSKEAMLNDEEEELQRRLKLGMPPKHAHKLGHLQFEYFDDLASSANIKKLNRAFQKIYLDNEASLKRNVSIFKKSRYEILENENFRKFNA